LLYRDVTIIGGIFMNNTADIKTNIPQRDYQFDNIRALLIFIVVFGHLLELIDDGPVTGTLYRVIYSFHMPAFLFVSGFFAKYDPKKILTKILLPYIVFQILYTLFNSILNKNYELQIQFTLPYWLLWYLLALFIYFLLLPLFETDNRDTAIVIITICFFISLTSGYDTGTNKLLSISRVLTFLPFFMAGFYSHRFKLKEWINKNKAFVLVFSAAVCLIWEVYYYVFEVSVNTMYGSKNYGGNKMALAPRFMFLFGACSWIFFLTASVSDKRIPFITTLGQRTVAVYLLHGFVVKLLEKSMILKEYKLINIIFAFLISVVLTAVLAAIPVNKIFNTLKTLYKRASKPIGNK
jgi:fucose 4-O-acetylase-like acetyltransferase